MGDDDAVPRIGRHFLIQELETTTGVIDHANSTIIEETDLANIVGNSIPAIFRVDAENPTSSIHADQELDCHYISTAAGQAGANGADKLATNAGRRLIILQIAVALETQSQSALQGEKQYPEQNQEGHS